MGNNCHISKNCFFDLRDKVIIEDNVVISMKCTFITHIDLSKSPLSEKYPASSSPIVIQSNTYIGTGTTILKGVKLGRNIIVGACSLINKCFSSDCLIAGIPAKSILKTDLQ